MIFRSFMALFAASILVSVQSPSYAHGDEDHGAAIVASVPGGATPRIEARTTNIELVAVVDADDMTVWIDRWADNAPIANANVNVTIDGQSKTAKFANGVYTVSDARLATAGAHQVAFLVTRAGVIESLSAELRIPERDLSLPSGSWTHWVAAAGVAVLAIIGAVFWRSRRAGDALIMVALGLFFMQPRTTQAHGDEDHSATAQASGSSVIGGGDAAMRLHEE
jgi:membrane fusion protein, heavy metal efflux system